MASWSSRRRTAYGTLAVVILAAAIGVPAFLFFYKAPTCSDGIQNGDEQGIDCGGSCTRLCMSAFLPLPSPSWVRFVPAGPGIYNLAAYIVNPNPQAGALAMPYSFELLDNQGITLGTATGKADIPAGRNSLVFVSAIGTGPQTPVRATFRFMTDPAWYVGADPIASLLVTDKKYSEDRSGSALDVTLSNPTTRPISAVDVYAILKDKDGTVIDFSKTIVDGVPAEGTVVAPFTWPASHAGKVISIDVLSVPE